MKKGNKFLYSLICLVVICGLTIPIPLHVKASPEILYVPDDFPTIQAAVVASIPGGTIIVRDGTYTENVVLNKTIILKGDGGWPEIDAGGTGSGITILADECTVEGFFVNSGSGYWRRGGIKIESDNNIVSGNRCSDNANGIFLEQSSNNSITGNDVILNSGSGIFLEDADNNNISGNTISDNEFGILIQTDSSHNIVSQNTISNHSYGMWIATSFNNRIYFNNFMQSSEMHHPFFLGTYNDWMSSEQMTYVYNNNTYTNRLGNYWDDYTGIDANGDGIGDTWYNMGGEEDAYPLMEPFENYRIISYAIIVAGQGGWPEKMGIVHGANNAYRVLRNLGFDDDHIFYLNSESPQDIDGNGDDEVDTGASLSIFKELTDHVGGEMANSPGTFVLFLIGHGLAGQFLFETLDKVSCVNYALAPICRIS